MAFESPLETTHLPPTTARAGCGRAGIARAGFFPRDTVKLTPTDATDVDYYAHREEINAEHPHTEVPQ